MIIYNYIIQRSVCFLYIIVTTNVLIFIIFVKVVKSYRLPERIFRWWIPLIVVSHVLNRTLLDPLII